MPRSKRAGGHWFAHEPPSPWALRDLPARAARFLHAAATHRGIAELLARGGYGEDDHAEGLTLLARVLEYSASADGLGADEQARSADGELNDWVKTHLPRFRAAAERLHPEALGLFAGLALHDERASALTVATLLERLGKRTADRRKRAVLATLERRGLDVEERARLAELVEKARAVGERDNVGTATAEEEGLPSAELVALCDWLRDWSTTAKTFVGRKDWLIRLGVVRRG